MVKHVCDERCIHTLAAKILNMAYDVGAISVFWVGDFLSLYLKERMGIECESHIILEGDVHNFTAIEELHYTSPIHGEVYAYQSCGRIGLDDWACCVVLTKNRLNKGMAIKAIMAGSKAYNLLIKSVKRKPTTDEELLDDAMWVKYNVEKELERAPPHIKALL
jgi:hypothetical protein